MDLRFTTVETGSRGHGRRRRFFVESKVESSLSRRQVKRYLDHGAQPLIVITKYHPEELVEDEGAYRLRWQEVHRALRQPGVVGAIDRQVCRWMTDYLEDLDMAYREDLSLADVESCGTLFRRVSTKKNGWSQLASRRVFEVAHDCTEMLDELQRDFLDRHPKLAGAPYSKGETLYGKWNDADYGFVSHHLGWHVRKSPWTKWNFLCAICWEDTPEKAAYLYLLLEGSTVVRHESAPELKKFVSRSTGGLDRGKLLRHLESCARKWGVI
jgi:hypothetical protein